MLQGASSHPKSVSLLCSCSFALDSMASASSRLRLQCGCLQRLPHSAVGIGHSYALEITMPLSPQSYTLKHAGDIPHAHLTLMMKDTKEPCDKSHMPICITQDQMVSELDTLAVHAPYIHSTINTWAAATTSLLQRMHRHPWFTPDMPDMCLRRA